MGRTDGVAVLAEGLIEQAATRQDLADCIDRSSATSTATSASPRSTSARMVKRRGRRLRCGAAASRCTITDKDIGYELRCADPIAFDAAYARDLGYHAIRFLAEGGSGAMVTVQDGRMVPIPFESMRTAEGRTRVRLVDTTAESYRVAREYMLRLEPSDFDDPAWVEKLAEAGGTTADELRARFAPNGGGR